MVNETERCVDILIERSNEIDRILSEFGTKHNTDDLIKIITDTQNYIRDNKPLIPPYILKKINQSLNRLEQHVEHSKRKLSFKFKSSTPSRNVNQKETAEKPIEINKVNCPTKLFGLFNKDHEKLALNQEDVDGKDISLINIKFCHVIVNGLADTARLKDLKNVSVDVLIARRAITVTNCFDCKFKLACQQLRIDSSENCEFEIYTIGGSMLEASNKIIFKELKSSNIQKIMTEAGMNDGTNNWKCINDFDWLSDQDSKNFEIVE